ncbi:MAG: aminotransferase class I/II-fold pyridoxal phosphate-dependent enzyme [Deltaproteobacteria bacterium]|nr:aminotransferase class I/II-fold pyridoxal phosphate-dependent enzyme [Deltaproteobacteria bacterium]
MDSSAPSRIKRAPEDLAILGGPRAFDDRVVLGQPNIGDRAKLHARLDAILDSKWLTNVGPKVQELEKRLAQYLGVEHCITVCNATIGLQMVARACFRPGGEVIAPSFTFVATCHALSWTGYSPVFGDVSPQTHNLDPASVESLICENTAGILAVHLWGRPAQVEELERIAKRHKLPLVFDAAHAFACTHRGKQVGNFGDAEVLSFHATKFFNSFEGGAIVTHDGALAAKLRLMRNFGFSSQDLSTIVGTNGKMSEISAAMGLGSLDIIESTIEKNRRNQEEYRKQLDNIPGMTVVNFESSEKHNFQYVVLEVDEKTARVSRDLLKQVLEAENVFGRAYFSIGCHEMAPYAGSTAVRIPLSESERLSKRIYVLPNGSAVDRDRIAAIGSVIRQAVVGAEQLRHLARPSVG